MNSEVLDASLGVTGNDELHVETVEFCSFQKFDVPIDWVSTLY